MRRLFYAVLALGVAFGAASCAKDTGLNPTESGQEVTVIAGQHGFADEMGTRIYHGEDDKGYWHSTEESIGIFMGDVVKNTKLKGTTADGGLTVEFSGNLSPAVDAGDYNLYAYYPYGNLTNTNQTYLNARVTVPTQQHPTLTSYDPQAAVMYATPKTVTATATSIDAVSTSFNFAIAVVKVQFADVATQTNNEPVLSFKMTVINNITGRVELNLQTGVFGNWFSNTEYTQKSVEAIYDASTGLVLNGTNSIILGIVPTTLPAGSSVVVEALTATYKISKTITVPSETIFNAGNVRVMKISTPTVTTLVSSDTPYTIGWKFNGSTTYPATSYTCTSTNTTAVITGDLTSPNFAIQSQNACWGGTGFNANNTTNDYTKYASFTVTAKNNAFSIKNVKLRVRTSKTGPGSTALLYQINNGTFTLVGNWVFAATQPSDTYNYPGGNNSATGDPYTFDLSDIVALQKITKNTQITFRIVPIKGSFTAATGTWYISNYGSNATTNTWNNNSLEVNGTYIP